MTSYDNEKYSSESSRQGAASDQDRIDTISRHDNPFATPGVQTPNTLTPSQSHQNFRSEFIGASTSGIRNGNEHNYFRSRRVKKGEVERPWLERKDPRQRWVTIIPIMGLVVGFIVVGILIWDGISSVAQHKYCEVLSDDFSSWNDKVWTKEVEVGGYGNGQFEVTTTDDENIFIKDGVLTVKPTLQDEGLITTDNTIDLLGNGCTGSTWDACVISTNTTNGTIVNPVKSGRINTKAGASIKYGRIEVVAKLPEGDWLWPAIWMLPTGSVYGEWPRSGEIDIMEARGNNHTYAQGGNNIMSSALHFGPNPNNDGWWRNNVKRKALHTTYSAGYNTFGVEWSEKYIFTYVNTRLLQVMYTHFDQPFFEYGKFPLADSNGTRLDNPWAGTNSNTAPFDQDFYLVINVAVGGTNGWFEDGKSAKPWLDGSPTARKDFWDAKDQWYPTWEKNGQMEVKSVKMWQQSGYKGCNA